MLSPVQVQGHTEEYMRHSRIHSSNVFGLDGERTTVQHARDAGSRVDSMAYSRNCKSSEKGSDKCEASSQERVGEGMGT